MIQRSDIILQLHRRDVKTVAVQAPEGLKREAVRFAFDLKREGFRVIMSGDPCYGSCDLDREGPAIADILVHIGHAPVDDTNKVIYEYYQVDIPKDSLREGVRHLSQKRIGLVTVTQHLHCIPMIQEFLANEGIVAVVKAGGKRTPHPGQVLGCSFEAAKAAGCSEILYVGTGLFHPLGVAIATNARVIALDPVTGIVQEVSAERLLRVRFALIEKAKVAEQFGILLSTKSGQRREELARFLVSLHPSALLVTMNEVTPDQLYNLGFPCYVNTACPRLAYDDQGNFPVPVLTPREFEIVCGVRNWEEYTVDQIP
ncbi:MAG: diphthamide biosynthesis enzyme Dph2 [Methanospirillaceae archaeon]|nr:diphthamide biosynthesis enzyme Dph2 [Methanospirillaceae archaeon]